MSPVLIVVLVVVTLVVVAYLFGLSPEAAGGRRAPPGLLRRRSKWRRFLPVLPLLLAVACLVFAFTGFRLDVRETAPTVLLVMDVSNSMGVTDVAPNRLAAAESAALAFLEELPPDFRVGLATFAGSAELAVAPTGRREAVEDALDALTLTPGTVIGDGLDVALDAIEEIQREAPDTPAAALLLSDGRDTGSVVPPHEAAVRAGELSVPVFTVVLGRVEEGGGGADLATLRDIADTSGGEAYTAGSAAELTARFENIGTRLSVGLEVDPDATPWVIGAIALTVLAGLMLVFSPR